jgi:POT family proton-dependent oligopeptide transporter
MNGASDRGFFGHPKGLRTLFFTEMWERFSYYGMRAILMLFMLAAVADGGLGMAKEDAGRIYAMYTSLAYLACIPGGWLADNFLGQRKAVFYGGIVIMLGHILLAMHGLAFFYSGLLCVILGTGLLKPNISAIVGGLYDAKDARRDSGFSIFYMGINIGAFASPLVCGYLAQNPAWRSRLESMGLDPKTAWHWGFAAAAVGMFFGLLQYVWTGRELRQSGLQPAPVRDAADAAARARTLRNGLALVLLVVLSLVGIGLARPEWLSKKNINAGYTVLLLAVVVGFFGRLLFAGNWTKAERGRLTVIAILFLAASVFWGVFEQAGSTLTVFADESTRNRAFGWDFPSSWWQSANAVYIVLFAPIFSWLWLALGRRNPTYAVKFAIGLALVGLGFVYLVGGARSFSGDWASYVATHGAAIQAAATQYGVELGGGAIGVGQVSEILAKARDVGAEAQALLPAWQRVSWSWLAVVYLLHTLGELCISPVGLSAMTKLAPARVVGQMLGVWFLGSSVGNFLGGSTASFYDKLALPTLLLAVAGGALFMALVMLILNRPMQRMLSHSEPSAAGSH